MSGDPHQSPWKMETDMINGRRSLKSSDGRELCYSDIFQTLNKYRIRNRYRCILNTVWMHIWYVTISHIAYSIILISQIDGYSLQYGITQCGYIQIRSVNILLMQISWSDTCCHIELATMIPHEGEVFYDTPDSFLVGSSQIIYFFIYIWIFHE
jgi:hypothetical protein